jgi:dUTP pyrophosphatase
MTKCSVCKRATHVSERAIRKNVRRNGRYRCFACSRASYVGRGNPNAKYAVDDNFFSTIDSELKAYLLGLIASDGTVRKSGFTIALHRKDAILLNILNSNLRWDTPIKPTGSLRSWTVNSGLISKDVCRHLKIKPGKKDAVVAFPDIPPAFDIHFMRGLFDGDGSIREPLVAHSRWPYPEAKLASMSARMRASIVRRYEGYDDGCSVSWHGTDCLDMLGAMYEESNFRMSRKLALYEDWCAWVPGLSGTGSVSKNGSFKARFVKSDINAKPPKKSRVSDSGFDLTLISIHDVIGDVTVYNTGIKVQPPYGWYFDLVPRSSIIKTGYSLANDVGVIDRSYTGQIQVPLRKNDKNAPDLILPARCVQLIPRPIVHLPFVEVTDFPKTDRGERGFGSTGGAG